MDLGATWYNKGKGKKGRRKGEGKYNKGKGYGGHGNSYRYNQPVGQGDSKDNKDSAEKKDTATKEKARMPQKQTRRGAK